MSPTFFQIMILGLLQGAAELLPVSSSAHVIVAEKLMRLDPSAPEMTFLLVMLHTGTMLAVLLYFWNAWKASYFSEGKRLRTTAFNVAAATAATLIVGLALKLLIEKIFLRNSPHGEVEHLFSQLPLIAAALGTAGIWILIAGFRSKENPARPEVGLGIACAMGLVQGLCLPFRGLSRSGTTISTGMLAGSHRRRVEEFSFALAVVITPAAIAVELHRLLKSQSPALSAEGIRPLLMPGFLGMIFSFIAGLLALHLLSRWLDQGRWHYFGYYCLAAAAAVGLLAHAGF